MKCKKICYHYKVSRSATGIRYANGQKRCTECGIFISYGGLSCPCCNCKLRTKPKSKKYRRMFYETKMGVAI